MKDGVVQKTVRASDDTLFRYLPAFLVRMARKELRSGFLRWEVFIFLCLAAVPSLIMSWGIYDVTIKEFVFFQDVLTSVGIIAFLWYLPARTMFFCTWDRGGGDFIRLLPRGEMRWMQGRFASALLPWLLMSLILFLFWFVEYSMTGPDGRFLCFFVLLCASALLTALGIWVAETNWFWRLLFCLLLLAAGGYPLVYTMGYWVEYMLPDNQYFSWVKVLGHFASWLPFVVLQTGLMAYAFLVLASRTAFSSANGQAARLRGLVWLQGGFCALLFFLSGVRGVPVDGPLPYFTGLCLVFAGLLFWADAALGMRPVFIGSLRRKGKWFRYPGVLKMPGWQSSVLDFGVLCLVCAVVSWSGYRWNGNEAGLWSIVLWFPLLFWANCVLVFMAARLVFRSLTPQMLPFVILVCAAAIVFFGHAFHPGARYSEVLGLIPFLNLEFCREGVPVSRGALAFIGGVALLYVALSWGYWRRYAAFERQRNVLSELKNISTKQE